jgi:PPM family protein phosphatase
MGTTLTALLLCGRDGVIAHIGDSRAYLLRGGELRQLTDDHSLVAEMVRDGRLPAGEARQHPYRSVLSRALGTEPDVEVDELRVSLQAGDVVLLCSDGLCGPVSDEKLSKALSAADPHKATRRLVDEALRRGGPDNITAVVVQLYDSDQPPAEPEATKDVEEPAAGGRRTELAADREEKDPPRRRWHWLLPAAPAPGTCR